MTSRHVARSALLSLALAGLAAACASSSKSRAPGSASDSGSKVLQAVVTEREFEGPGSAGGGSMRGSGTWYLAFEAQDGDKTVHYRFAVSQQQYFRYPEGTHVEIVLSDERLREIRSGKD